MLVTTLIQISIIVHLTCPVGNIEVSVSSYKECQVLQKSGSYGVVKVVKEQIDNIILEKVDY